MQIAQPGGVCIGKNTRVYVHGGDIIGVIRTSLVEVIPERGNGGDAIEIV
ncbi:MAG: hypothetical protein HDS75_02205 [Bacteroidales bacterium]|nr:hypothetical protein [Bacteroidales bacterium]